MKHFLLVSTLLTIAGGADISREGRGGHGWHKHHGHGEDKHYKEYQSPPFSIIRATPQFEERLYPSAQWACTNLTVDTAADPLWGLEGRNYKEIRRSNRYDETPSSLMFKTLLGYIQGGNDKNESISDCRRCYKIKKSVVVAHHLIKEDEAKGDIELQEMCLYLETKFQVGGSAQIPPPSDASVYIVKKPDQQYFVGKFAGYAFTSATWLNYRDILQTALEGEAYNNKLYLTAQKSHHFPEKERWDEVMIPKITDGNVQELGVNVEFSQKST